MFYLQFLTEWRFFLTFIVSSQLRWSHSRGALAAQMKSLRLCRAAHSVAPLLLLEHMFDIFLVWRLLWGLQISSGQKVKDWKDGWLTQWIKLWTSHYLWLGAYGVGPAALRGAEKAPSAALARPVRVCWTKKQTEQRHLNLQLGLKSWEANPVQKKQHANCSSLCMSMCVHPRAQENITHIFLIGTE